MWQTNSLRLEHCLIFSSTCANYAIFSPVLVNFAKLGIDRSCAGLRILLQMKKKHHIKKYYLHFQLFLVHWRLRWAISAKARRLKIKLFEKSDWRVLAHEIDWVGVFHQVFHWHISPEQAWLILFWYGNTKVCYWTIHILDLIVPKHPDINYWQMKQSLIQPTVCSSDQSKHDFC